MLLEWLKDIAFERTAPCDSDHMLGDFSHGRGKERERLWPSVGR